jgi:glycosyltransferase involved in cell wall biosynthesis
MPDDYLAFLGRISPEKRVDRAIEVAQRTGMTLKVAAKIDRADRDYFEKEIRPLFDDPRVEFVGEVGGRDKDELLGRARALIFPIDWPEPFGLVMIEALACGTPVIAWSCGSVPEVIDHGVTGFIVDSLGGAVRAVENVHTLSRQRCREVFEKRFSVERMAADYVALYEKLLAESAAKRKATSFSNLTTQRPIARRRVLPADFPVRIDSEAPDPWPIVAGGS